MSSRVAVVTDIHKIRNRINIAEKKVTLSIRSYVRNVMQPIIVQKIQQLIVSGGSSNTKFSWGYWQNYGSVWRYTKGKANSFSFSTRLPIHPKSYGKRKSRKVFRAGQNALIDTKGLLNSFKIVAQSRTNNSYLASFGSTRGRLLDKHENGERVPSRKVLSAIHFELEQSPTFYNYHLNNIKDNIKRMFQ
jgi:hypothetical protein